MTDEALLTIYGRVAAHEYVLEILLANALVDVPDDIAEKALSDIVNKSKSSQLPGHEPEDAADAYLTIGAECTKALDNLCSKVRSRRDNLRATPDRSG